jgi:hypothetical protein
MAIVDIMILKTNAKISERRVKVKESLQRPSNFDSSHS